MRASVAQTAYTGLLLMASSALACGIGVSGLASVAVSPDDGGSAESAGDVGAPRNPKDATTPTEDTGAGERDGGAPPHDDGGTTVGEAGDAIPSAEAGGDASGPSEAGQAGDASEAGDAITIPGACQGDAGGCLVVPPGWTLVAFAATQSSACPPGFASQLMDLVEGPSATSACSCGDCTVAMPASCSGGALTVHYDYANGGAPRCNLLAQPGTTPLAATTPGSCGTDLYQGSYASFDIMYSEPAASGGACAAPGAPHQNSVTYSSRDRACGADAALASSCSGGGCAPPAVGGAYRPCVAAPGTVTCPQGPFSERHVAGAAATFTCSACACAMSSSCTGGTVTLYTDSTCANNAQPIPIGSCYPIYQSGASYNSYRYDPGAVNSTCIASGASTAQNVALGNPETICCAP